MNESLDESGFVLEDVDLDERIQNVSMQCENDARGVISGQEKKSIIHLQLNYPSNMA